MPATPRGYKRNRPARERDEAAVIVGEIIINATWRSVLFEAEANLAAGSTDEEQDKAKPCAQQSNGKFSHSKCSGSKALNFNSLDSTQTLQVN